MTAASTVKVAPGLALDADYVAGASFALLGKRGAGKTYACRVLAESLFDAHVQTVIVDPMGVFWGLRASADGEGEGLPIPVFGGQHGDAPLESSAGALMADLVVQERLSMILDLSGFGSRTQERSFAAAFLDRLYRTNRDLVHLIVDEADLFAPQKPRGEDTHLLVTMENIVRRGRNKAIGITMASQRAAVLNKDVLTQIDGLVALRVAAPQDRDAIRDWVRGQGDEETWQKIAPSLPRLANGQSWWWIPEKGVLKQVQVRRTRTYDSSPTRTRGEASRAPKTFADVDLEAISGRIAATIERAKATDPRELTRRIRQLEKELAARPEAEPQVVEVPVPVLDETMVSQLVRASAEAAQTEHDLNETATMFFETVNDLARAVDKLRAGPAAASAAPPRPVAVLRQGDPPDSVAALREAFPGAAPEPPATHEGAFTSARRRILDALAELESIGITQPSKKQLALWVGVSFKSSGYTNNLGALRSAGLIDYPGPGTASLTDEGRALGRAGEALTDDSELHERIRSLVGGARWRILESLIGIFPDSMSRAALADAAGASVVSSGYTNNLGSLRSLGLIDYPGPGRVAATDILFLGR